MLSNNNEPLIPKIEVPKKVGERHMAIDTSALSEAPEGVIGSIGFVIFDPRDGGGANETYMKTIDWDQKGRSYNWSVVRDWMGTSSMARRCILNFSTPIPLLAAMSAVNEAYIKHQCVAIWGNKISIDQVDDAMVYCKLTPPWGPGQIRDVAAAASIAGEMGNQIALTRDPTEPEAVPLGNAAFVARVVRHIYQAKGGAPTKEEVL